jgi:flavin-binding protein dodecin
MTSPEPPTCQHRPATPASNESAPGRVRTALIDEAREFGHLVRGDPRDVVQRDASSTLKKERAECARGNRGKCQRPHRTQQALEQLSAHGRGGTAVGVGYQLRQSAACAGWLPAWVFTAGSTQSQLSSDLRWQAPIFPCAAQLNPCRGSTLKEQRMAKQDAETGVYRVTEIIGTSQTSWEDAAKNAIEIAAKSLRDLRIAEVSKLDLKVEEGKVVAYRARLMLSFKYEG